MEELNITPPLSSLSEPDESIINDDKSSFGKNNSSVLDSELNSLYNGVGLRDISSSGVIELRGNDVLDFLHRIGTNHVKNLTKGDIAKTIFTTEKGKIIDSTVLLNLDEYQLLICNQDHQEKMMIWLNKYVISDDVKLSNISGKYTLLEVIGPQTDSFMLLINGSIVNNIAPNTVKIINTEGIIFFLMKHYDYNGQLIYWILADPVYAQKLIRYMVENKGPFDFNLIGDEAYNIYRIENKIPASPNEINDLHNPHELGLMKLVDSTKGCYIGQEVIARLETYNKVQNHFSGFVLSDPLDEITNLKLYDDANNEAGVITSTVFSKKVKKQIGIGFVISKYFEEGVVLFGKTDEGILIRVTVKKLSFKK
jgi:folate-binding protein YgfZ